MARRRSFKHVLVVVSAFAMALSAVAPLFAVTGAAAAGQSLDPNTQFYVPQPDHGAIALDVVISPGGAVPIGQPDVGNALGGV